MKNPKTRLVRFELRLPEGEALGFLKALRQSGKRIEETETPLYKYLGLKVDLVARRIYLRNKEIHLSPMQYEFLSQLVRHAGRVVTHQELLESVWGGRQDITGDCMRVFVFQIRHKIESDPSKPQLLKTEPGVGYRLEAPVGASSTGGAASSENGRRRYRLESPGRTVGIPSTIITQALTAH